MVFTHYKTLKDIVKDWKYGETEFGRTVEVLLRSCVHYQSPLTDEEIIRNSDKSEEVLNQKLVEYIEKSDQGKVLPIEYDICVEDQYSAVFMKNLDNNRLYVVTYQNADEKETGLEGLKGFFHLGVLQLQRSEDGKMQFAPSGIGHYRIIEENLWDISINKKESIKIGHDIVMATISAIMEFQYIEANRIVPATSLSGTH